MSLPPIRTLLAGSTALQKQGGFNLLEVLITLIILAVGLLGLATLQNLGLRLGHESYERTQATILVYDIIDRMRANPMAVTAGNYNIALTGAPPALGSDCGVVVCNAADLATYDLSQWLSTISGTPSASTPGLNRPTLIGGQGQIGPVPGAPVTATGGTLFDITVEWLEQRHGQGANPETMRQTVRVHLP